MSVAHVTAHTTSSVPVAVVAASSQQGLVAISHVANTSGSITAAAAAAAWPSISTFYSSSNTLDEQKRALFAAAQGTTRITPVEVHALLVASNATLASNTTILTVGDAASNMMCSQDMISMHL